jgi:hypothetical protein
MSRGFRVAVCAMAAAAVAAAMAPGAATPSSYEGVFALQDGVPRVAGHLLVVPGFSPLEARLDFWSTLPSSSAPLRNYDVDIMKRMHLLAIGDDLMTFLHVHPTLGANGHFLINLTVPRPGLYHLYADWTPHVTGRQVLRFDVAFGDPGAMVRTQPKSERTVRSGPYSVTLTSVKLQVGVVTMVRARISRGGVPAKDLQPYLGAAAHAVFINSRDLSYVHVHPTVMGEMGNMNVPGMRVGEMEMRLAPGSHVSPGMMFHVVVRRPGTYLLWLQFRGGNRLEVAPFVLAAAR